MLRKYDEDFHRLFKVAEVPINQGIAVTGSVNQWGDIQPIGGVNEKIEGFFHIWSIGHISEGIEILTGVHAGHIRNQKEEFPPDTIFSKVEEKFTKMYEWAIAANKIKHD